MNTARMSGSGAIRSRSRSPRAPPSRHSEPKPQHAQERVREGSKRASQPMRPCEQAGHREGISDYLAPVSVAELVPSATLDRCADPSMTESLSMALHADISGSQVQWTRRIKESKAGGMDGSNINVKEVRETRYLVKRVGSSDEDPDNRSLNGLSKRSSTRSSDTRKIGRAEGWAPIH